MYREVSFSLAFRRLWAEISQYLSQLARSLMIVIYFEIYSVHWRYTVFTTHYCVDVRPNFTTDNLTFPFSSYCFISVNPVECRIVDTRIFQIGEMTRIKAQGGTPGLDAVPTHLAVKNLLSTVQILRRDQVRW
jgi:hypothetical protein